MTPQANRRRGRAGSGARWAVAAAAALLALPAARAATVTEVAQSYTVGTTGATASNMFSVSAAGNLDISLTDLLWPKALSSLSFELTNAQGKVLGTLSGAGTLDVALTSGGTYFALTYGQASPAGPASPLPYGTYGIALQFTPTVVPLPSAALLLASSLALFAAVRLHSPRRRDSRSLTAAAINV